MIMRRAFGVLELLIVLVVIIVIYFSFFHSQYGRKNPFDDNYRVNSQQELIDSKIQDIENSKAIRKQIEDNLNKGI